MKNIKKSNTPFPCKYHEDVYLTQSKECKASYVCSQCKSEKKSGRDGIYGIIEIIQIMEERMLSGLKDGKKMEIRDEQWAVFKRNLT